MKTEKKIVLIGVGAALLIILGAAVFAPAEREDDPRPSTFNSGAAGAKASYLLLQKLGYRVSRWERPLTAIGDLDVAHTTLVLSNPWGGSSKEEQNALGTFLKRGGRVLATGEEGMSILPGFYWIEDGHPPKECTTRPEGTSALAMVGPVKISPLVLAKDNLLEVEVAQECDDGAAVITYPYGEGTVIWWANVTPLTNRALHEDTNLKLLMASIGGNDRAVVFDEWHQAYSAPSPWDKTKGLPIAALVLQLLFAGVFLVLSYGRRHGPVRTLARIPRTSPLEFAHSMGNLYYRAGAGEAAIHEARGRLMVFFERQCGLPREIVDGSPEGVATALQERFGYTNDQLIPLLEESAANQRVSSARAFTMVQSLYGIGEELRRIVSRVHRRSTKEKELV